MKAFVQTKYVNKNSVNKPYLAGQNVPYSVMELEPNSIIARVAGTPEQISLILNDSNIIQLTEKQVLAMAKEKDSEFELYKCDVADMEVDILARTNGIDPKLRSDVKISRANGIPVLQEQENYLMGIVSEKKGLTRQYWDEEAGSLVPSMTGQDIENKILDGSQDSQEFVLSRIRLPSEKKVPTS